MVENARSHSTHVSQDELWHFALTWILGFHGILVFAFSWFVGAFLFPGQSFEYAWKVALAALVLSSPAAIDTVIKDLNFTGISLEFAGWGYIGGVVATVILAGAILWRHIDLTLNQGVAFVALFALAVGFGFAEHEMQMQKLHQAAFSGPSN